MKINYVLKLHGEYKKINFSSGKKNKKKTTTVIVLLINYDKDSNLKSYRL